MSQTDLKLRIAHALMEQASARFDSRGPNDARGAAFWDAYCGLVEGTLDIPETVPQGWGNR